MVWVWFSTVNRSPLALARSRHPVTARRRCSRAAPSRTRRRCRCGTSRPAWRWRHRSSGAGSALGPFSWRAQGATMLTIGAPSLAAMRQPASKRSSACWRSSGVGAGQLFDDRLKHGELRHLQLVVSLAACGSSRSWRRSSSRQSAAARENQLDSLETHSPMVSIACSGRVLPAPRLWKHQLTQPIRGRGGAPVELPAGWSAAAVRGPCRLRGQHRCRSEPDEIASRAVVLFVHGCRSFPRRGDFQSPCRAGDCKSPLRCRRLQIAATAIPNRHYGAGESIIHHGEAGCNGGGRVRVAVDAAGRAA